MRNKFASRLRKQIVRKGAHIFIEEHLPRGKGWWTCNKKRTSVVVNFAYDGELFMVCDRDRLAAYRSALDMMKDYENNPIKYLWHG